MKVIETAMAQLLEQENVLKAKKQTKPTMKKLEEIQVKKQNLEVFSQYTELEGLYVAPDIDSEVGRIVQVMPDTGRVVVESFDGETEDWSLYNLLFDEKGYTTEVSAGATVKISESYPDELLAGNQYELARLIYPGGAELSGLEGVIAPEYWDMAYLEVEEVEEVVSEADIEASKDEAIELLEKLQEHVLSEPSEPMAPVVKEFDGYRFTIEQVDNTFVGKLESIEGNLIFTSEPCEYFHDARSQAVLEYHRLTQKLYTGDRISIHPWLLAWAPENRDIYHPGCGEEKTQQAAEIEQDIRDGIGILQRLGISDKGEIFTGHTRGAAGINAGADLVPVEVFHFATRAHFIEAMINANKQREKTLEQQIRERSAKYELCSQEAKQAQLEALARGRKETPEVEAPATPQVKGKAWDRAVEGENISGKTAAKQAKIIQFIDNVPDRALADKVRRVLNEKKKTEAALQLTRLKPEEAHKAADEILADNAKSVAKALAKTGATVGTIRGQAPSGAIPKGATPYKAGANSTEVKPLPEWLMRSTVDAMGDIDIDVLPDAAFSVDAVRHITEDSRRIDWIITGKDDITVFANLVNQDSLDYLRSLEAQLSKGNVGNAIVFASHKQLDIPSRQVLKKFAVASCEILKPVAINNQEYTDIMVYYFGNDATKFCKVFDGHGDVRTSFKIKDTLIPEIAADVEPVEAPSSSPVQEVPQTDNIWKANTNGASATLGKQKLTVIRATDDTFYAEINGKKAVEGIPSIDIAKTIVYNMAQEGKVA